MSEVVTLELPEPLAQSARVVATRTNRRIEDVLVEWLERLVVDTPIEALPDDQVLALYDMRMGEEQQEELGALLERQREQSLDGLQRARLDGLMAVYRRGQVNKARAAKVAVERGLIPPLG
jgi:hypothetical protein